MELASLKLEVVDRIALVTISREQFLNALNSEILEELRAVLAALQREEQVGGVILTGAGDHAFVAGADVQEMSGFNSLQARDFSRRFQSLLDLIETLGKPVVAAINGFALGGGCELALACHLRVASQGASLGQPEAKLGIIPGAGGTQRLPRLVGEGRALEMLLLGEPVSAEEAYRIGLVNHVVAQADLIPVCRELLGRMLKNGPLALRYSMEAVHNGVEMSLEEGLLLESTLFGMCFATEDGQEGMRAFLEKRPARFQGK
ncbi:MAG: enoyl-CoA hydratase/isomerase family protein [Acidobacteria bacterium]|nr:enoyl-CoA hydratase/isomerase family protein [Acidobacteriota bacterium]